MRISGRKLNVRSGVAQHETGHRISNDSLGRIGDRQFVDCCTNCQSRIIADRSAAHRDVRRLRGLLKMPWLE